MKVLIIIPAYNEELNIVRVVNNLILECPQYDYVVINDGSYDSTVELCKINNLNYIDLPINLGLAGAFQTGMRYAWENGYDCAIQFDADGQHLPQYIPEFVKKIEEGFDVVIGSRFKNNKKDKSMRMLGSRFITLAIKLTTGKKISDPTSGMRMFSRNMIREFAYNINYGPEPDTISFLLKNGASVTEVQVEMLDREYGESYLKPMKAIAYMTKMMVSIILVQNFRKRG